MGVGGPLSPVVTNRANTGTATNGTSVATNALELGVLGEPVDNYSMLGTVAQSTGTAVPVYDPALVGQLNWSHQTTPQTNLRSYGTNALVSSGFHCQCRHPAGIRFRRAGVAEFQQPAPVHQRAQYGLQPLHRLQPGPHGHAAAAARLRPGLNRRFIRIAGNERKIASLLFQQQLIATAYGVIRLYTDFVALYEDEKVKEESVREANKLLSDTQAQVEEGTLAQVELTRAKAQLFSTQQDLINARGLVEEQEAILKNVLTRDEDAQLRSPASSPPTR